MTEWKRVQGLLEWLDEHPVAKLIAKLFLIVGAVVALYTGVRALWPASTPSPEVVQVRPEPQQGFGEGFPEPAPGKMRWVATVVNEADAPVVITEARYKIIPLPDDYAQFVNAPVAAPRIVTLPIGCDSGEGVESVVPPVAMEPNGLATFVVEGDRSDLACLIQLTFETNRGPLKPTLMVAY